MPTSSDFIKAIREKYLKENDYKEFCPDVHKEESRKGVTV